MTTTTLSYKQKRAIWSAMSARNRPEALRQMEMYVTHDEAVQLQDEAEAPLEIPPLIGPHPVEQIMAAIKKAVA